MTISRSALAACLMFACMAASAAPDTVLMQVGDTTVTEADVQAEILRAPPQARAQALASRQTLHLIVRNLMTRRLLAREAQASGLAATDPVRTQVRLSDERVLADARLQQFTTESEPDAAALESYAKTTYAAQPERFAQPALTHARHILIEGDTDASKAEAEKLLAQIRGGASFEELAKAHSQDKGSAARGGDLGSFPDDKTVPEFEAALKALKNPGDVSEPVKTQFGWHLIELVERTPARQRGFDEVKDELVREGRAQLLQSRRSQKVTSILDGAQLHEEAIDALLQQPAR